MQGWAVPISHGFLLSQFPVVPFFPLSRDCARSAGVNPGRAVITVQNAEQMPPSWGRGAARWDWLPGVQEALLSSPVLRNQAPWTVISELSCSLSSPCRLGGPRHGAYGKEAVSGQGDLFGAGVEGAGHS